MLDKTKQIARKLDKTKQIARILTRGAIYELDTSRLRAARGYIDEYWGKLERYHPEDEDSLLGLPYPYLVPSYAEGHEFDYNEMFYWDSYFMVQGMLDEDHKELVVGILENLLAMFVRLKTIPNASRTYMSARSQPPFLTSFIFDVYEAYNMDKEWLKRVISIAQDEYTVVWMGMRKPNARQVYQGLSRYYDFNYLHDIAEAESGWDMTPRFNRRCLNYLPADLNSLLYKYEADFARAAKILGNAEDERVWMERADARVRAMNELMWDRFRGFFYDYNYVKKKRGTVSSLAGFYPMWAGMVSEKQAQKLVKNLKRFEQKGGLTTTDTPPLNQLVPGMLPTQWSYPNGWAPTHFVVVKGLQRYGYHDDARRIALKWLKCNLDWFNRHGEFLEKYNVVSPEKPPAKGLYPSQSGFGWTNAVFERFCQDFIDEAK